MATPESVPNPQIEASSGLTPAGVQSFESTQDHVLDAVYALSLLVSVSLWFIAIRAPLWLDETGSFWQISEGFWKIPSRQGGLSFPAYSYILWFFSKILGTSEIALRIPSVLAMLAAAYFLYRAARELFDRDIAFVTTAVFCVHPIVILQSIDVRPYACAALAISVATFLLVRLRHDKSKRTAALLGLSSAFIVYFHFLFAVILPGLFLCLLALALGRGKASWKQVGIALLVFALAFSAVIPGLLYMVHTRSTHVFDGPPQLQDLGWTLAPVCLPYILGALIFVAAVTRKLDLEKRLDSWSLLLCTSLGLVPILILYGVSAGTSIHMFTARHRLVAIPGIALCWGFLVSRVNSRLIRLLFCIAVVSTTAYLALSSPFSHTHGYTWKYALEIAEKSASVDNAPVLICSDLPEADYTQMPEGDAAKDNPLFIQLSYYKLTVPVVGLPRTFNAEARRVGSAFVLQAVQNHQRFLALGYAASYDTLRWLTDMTAETHEVRTLGQPDEVVVLEFVPRTETSQ